MYNSHNISASTQTVNPDWLKTLTFTYENNMLYVNIIVVHSNYK